MSECECESPSVAVACFRASLVLEIVTDCSSWPRARARTRPRRKIKIVAISKPSFFACVSAPSTVSSFFFSLPFLLCQSCATSVLFYLSTFPLNPIISLRSNISLKPLTLIRDYRPTSLPTKPLPNAIIMTATTSFIRYRPGTEKEKKKKHDAH